MLHGLWLLVLSAKDPDSLKSRTSFLKLLFFHSAAHTQAFFTAAYQVIFQEVRAAFDSPNLQEYLRCDDSLQEMIKHARIAHLNQYYGPKICRIVGKPPLENIVLFVFFASPF